MSIGKLGVLGEGLGMREAVLLIPRRSTLPIRVMVLSPKLCKSNTCFKPVEPGIREESSL